MRRAAAAAVVVCGDGAQAQAHAVGCLERFYPTTRNEFPALLNCMNLTGAAVEVGVQSGENAMNFLSSWAGAELVLVDSWTHVPSLDYIDIANVDQGRMEVLHDYTQQRCQAEERARIVRTWSDAAASEVAPESVDFVYLDARHDWHGVVSDLVSWWPKVKVGGILAGHDFVDGELPEGDFFCPKCRGVFLWYWGGSGHPGGGPIPVVFCYQGRAEPTSRGNVEQLRLLLRSVWVLQDVSGGWRDLVSAEL
mmetsp:Transcript_94723/g.253357  ORF Transcript_94723/g.253357 Transcript_94723/m.253357 type:complete len:251 (+) Transcript_94723:58-810(+)